MSLEKIKLWMSCGIIPHVLVPQIKHNSQQNLETYLGNVNINATREILVYLEVAPSHIYNNQQTNETRGNKKQKPQQMSSQKSNGERGWVSTLKRGQVFPPFTFRSSSFQKAFINILHQLLPVKYFFFCEPNLQFLVSLCWPVRSPNLAEH